MERDNDEQWGYLDVTKHHYTRGNTLLKRFYQQNKEIILVVVVVIISAIWLLWLIFPSYRWLPFYWDENSDLRVEINRFSKVTVYTHPLAALITDII